MKKFKTKKNHSFLKSIFFIILILLSSYYVFKYLNNLSNKNSDPEKYVKYLLSEGFNNELNEYKYSDPLDLTNPLTLIEKSLNFNYNHVLTTTPNTLETINKSNAKNNQDPLIYIYNTHDEEAYALDNNQGYNIAPNVKLAAYMLQEKLENTGLKAIVETTSISSILKEKSWNYTDSYKASRILLNNTISKYPSIKYFIDLHRDSSEKNKTTLDTSKETYAKMLFIVGLENPNYSENLHFANSLSAEVNDNLNDLSRGIYKKEGPGVNGIYNQDISGNSMLIELGGYENSIDEVAKTINILGDTLYKYIEGENNEKAQL